jgi:hypothetical protein
MTDGDDREAVHSDGSTLGMTENLYGKQVEKL